MSAPAPYEQRAVAPGGLAVAAGSVALLALLVAGWYAASRLTFVVPSPVETVTVLAQEWTDRDYLYSAQVTFWRIVAGLGIGVAIGILGGFVLGVSALARATFQSFVMTLYAIPKILLYPLVIPFLTIGTPSKVFMGVVSSTFPTMIMVAAAIAATPAVYTKLARSLLATRRQYLFKVLLPATARAVVTAVRVATSFAVLGVVLAEFFASDVGLGRSLSQSYNVGDYDHVFATVLTLLVITFGVSFGLWTLEKRLDR
ncbi:MAG: ABC transporter permease subunit [Micromonosporaceae bacterium]|nr:ABC transporter permease subunit [Micromonosporaceae bacterium]